MDALIHLDQLKRYARVEHDFENDTLIEITKRATEIVIDYLEASERVSTSPVEWDIESVPEVVRTGILEVGTNLYKHRGDDGKEDGPITIRVRNILARYRRPALA